MVKFCFAIYDPRLHLDFLFKHMTDPEEHKMFLSYHSNNSLRDFEGWIQDRLKYFYNEFFIVESLHDNDIMGFVYSYEQSMRDGHIKVATYISPKYRKYGIGAFATINFIDHIFTYYPFRRIYCDVYEYNEISIRSLLDCGFKKTGCLLEYRFYNGKYYDLYLLTISRKEFYEHCSRFLEDKRDELH